MAGDLGGAVETVHYGSPELVPKTLFSVQFLWPETRLGGQGIMVTKLEFTKF